jgi:hypothetical protein
VSAKAACEGGLFWVQDEGVSPATEQFEEKLGSAASGAKALSEKRDSIAALAALRQPKASFPTDCESAPFQNVTKFKEIATGPHCKFLHPQISASFCTLTEVFGQCKLVRWSCDGKMHPRPPSVICFRGHVCEKGSDEEIREVPSMVGGGADCGRSGIKRRGWSRQSLRDCE